MDNTLREIQAEFINLIESSKLFSEVTEVEKGRFAFSKTFPTDSNAIRVKTSKGWQPTPVQWVERLLDDVYLFWSKKAPIIYQKLSESEDKCIQTEPVLLQKGLRKFGCFFDFILVPDQLLLLYGEHFGDRRLIDWEALVISTIRIGVTYLENRELLLPQNENPRIILVPSKRIIDKKYEEHSWNAVISLGSTFL